MTVSKEVQTLQLAIVDLCKAYSSEDAIEAMARVQASIFITIFNEEELPNAYTTLVNMLQALITQMLEIKKQRSIN